MGSMVTDSEVLLMLGRPLLDALQPDDVMAAVRIVRILRAQGWHERSGCEAEGVARYEEGVDQGRDDMADRLYEDIEMEHAMNPAHWGQPGGSLLCEVGACAARRLVE